MTVCIKLVWMIYVFADSPNAFGIRMRGSRLLMQPTLPSTIAEPKNNKQQLWNDVLSFLSNKGLKQVK